MPLISGEPAPSFRAASALNPDYAFDTAAGRYIMLAILGGPDADAITDGVNQVLAMPPDLFDDRRASLFAVVPDTVELRDACQDRLPGLRWLFDGARAVEKLYEASEGPRWFLLDPSLRILGMARPSGVDRLLDTLKQAPSPDHHAGAPLFAPVLLAPRVFEPEFCRTLIDHYDSVGGSPSGFMREIGGVTRLVNDGRHKRRSDVDITDASLQQAARARIVRRLLPEIRKAFHFEATRMERYLVACYEADGGGWFRPHRDNTTKGTAHRRFAVSINLNADFEGGCLRFPEFGDRLYRPPPGGAVVFSCSLLHEATPVTRGLRYAFLPFLYDEAGAEIRARNLKHLDPALRPEEQISTGA